MEPIDICISFDTTGSMYPCLTQVRRVATNLVNKLFNDIPNLRIAIIAHGDYCDQNSTYVTKHFDFSQDRNKITNFINTVGPTGGGDAPECYELVLNEARTQLSWQHGNKKVLVMIGDDVPHHASYPMNYKNIDWRNELGLLIEAGINVYGVHAMPGVRRHSKHFYEEIAQKTGGFYITLDQFASVGDMIMGVCYRQSSMDQFQDYVSSLEKTGALNRGLRDSFARMGATTASIYTTIADLIPVPSGRFQVMDVDADNAIKMFVESQGVTFKKGRGFYELTKAEKVQQYKEIIMQDKNTGDFYAGSEARRLLGLSPQTVSGGLTENLRAKDLDKYRVFIQSTSVNRKLIEGTKFLYEVDDWDKVAV